MAADRGRRQGAKRSVRGNASTAARRVVRLAPEVKLISAGHGQELPMLLCPEGRVPLNDGAVAILQLCDGNRTRAQIEEEISGRAGSTTLAADVRAFLDAALERGWIV